MTSNCTQLATYSFGTFWRPVVDKFLCGWTVLAETKNFDIELSQSMLLTCSKRTSTSPFKDYMRVI